MAPMKRLSVMRDSPLSPRVMPIRRIASGGGIQDLGKDGDVTATRGLRSPIQAQS